MPGVLAARLPELGTVRLSPPSSLQGQAAPGAVGEGWEGSAHPEASRDPRGHPHIPRQQLELGTLAVVVCVFPVVPAASSAAAHA